MGGRKRQVVTGSGSAPSPEHPGKRCWAGRWPGEQEDTRTMKETPPPVAVAGISCFRSKGRDNLKMPQFLEILWHMESIGISPALSSTGIQGNSSAQLSMAETCAGLASARFSACLPQISSSTGRCLKEAERGQGHRGAADLPLLGSFTSTHQEGLSQHPHTFPTAGPPVPGLNAKLGLWLFISVSAAPPSWGRNRLVFPFNCCFCAA